jgi:rfaE bifunctional protein nucleotidyltransferase chain/domain
LGTAVKGFTNGCYDILHVGHLRLLQYLKNKCEYVVVGIDSDKRVKELKGPDRPFNNEKDRKYMLESLTFVDKVVIFNSESDLINLVLSESPDLMVIGNDYKNRHVVGSEHAKKIEFFEKIDGHSTTRILQHRFNW